MQDLRTYLSLENAFARRLLKAWRKQAAPVYKKIEQACQEGRFEDARRLVQELDLTETGQQNREWIRYLLRSFAIYGARNVAQADPAFVQVGAFDRMLNKVTDQFLQFLEHNATTQMQEEALQSIAEQEANARAQQVWKVEHSSGIVMVEIAGPMARELDRLRSLIADQDLMGQGKDVEGNHVTIRYGLEGYGDSLRDYLESFPAPTLTLGRIKVFPPSQHSNGSCPVVVEVLSTELHEINDHIDEQAQWKARTFQTYQPHATLAYIKPDRAEQYRLLEPQPSQQKVQTCLIGMANGDSEVVQFRGRDRHQVLVQKNPYHDAQGLFTDKEHASHGGSVFGEGGTASSIFAQAEKALGAAGVSRGVLGVVPLTKVMYAEHDEIVPGVRQNATYFYRDGVVNLHVGGGKQPKAVLSGTLIVDPRFKKEDDPVGVVVHELGHHLDYQKTAIAQKLKWDKVSFDTTLQEMEGEREQASAKAVAAFSKKYGPLGSLEKNYWKLAAVDDEGKLGAVSYLAFQNRWEWAAEGIRSYVQAPSLLKRVAPKTYEFVHKFLTGAFPVEKEEVIQKAEQAVKFVDQGEKQILFGVNLNALRLASWGFIAEATARGYEEYRVTNSLEGNTCGFCRMTNGKVFRVEQARRIIAQAVDVENTDDLKITQPWPNTTKESVARLNKLTTDELATQGFCVPPFHPHCKCVLVRVGASNEISETSSVAEEHPIPPQKVTPEAFQELGVAATDEQVGRWNDRLGMSPVDVLSRLSGQSIQQILDSRRNTVRFPSDGDILLLMAGVTLGAKFVASIAMDPYGSMKLTQTDVVAGEPEAQEQWLRRYFDNAINVGVVSSAQELQVRVPTGDAATYLRLRFLPSQQDWESFRQEALTWTDDLVLRMVLENREPSSAVLLADLAGGPELLARFSGIMTLNLLDRDAVAQTKEYLQ